MRNKLVLPAILALVFSAAACGKPESEVGVTPAQPTPAATEDAPALTDEVTETPGDETPTATDTEQAPATPAPAQTPAPAVSPTPQVQPSEPAPATPPADPEPAVVTPPEPVTTPAAVARPKSDKLPKNHTVDYGGVLHAPGETNPAQRCASCHGAELKGGKISQISCFECHEKNWP